MTKEQQWVENIKGLTKKEQLRLKERWEIRGLYFKGNGDFYTAKQYKEMVGEISKILM